MLFQKCPSIEPQLENPYFLNHVHDQIINNQWHIYCIIRLFLQYFHFLWETGLQIQNVTRSVGTKVQLICILGLSKYFIILSIIVFWHKTLILMFDMTIPNKLFCTFYRCQRQKWKDCRVAFKIDEFRNVVPPLDFKKWEILNVLPFTSVKIGELIYFQLTLYLFYINAYLFSTFSKQHCKILQHFTTNPSWIGKIYLPSTMLMLCLSCHAQSACTYALIKIPMVQFQKLSTY